jgi:hypothetical protein
VRVEDLFPKCGFCNETLDPRADGVYRKMQGWAQGRSSGGTNHIALREELGEYAHAICIDLAKRRHESMQPSLFS